MAKNTSKIYRRAALMLLAIIISGLFNICLFTFRAKAATAPLPTPKINFSSENNGDCFAEPITKTKETISRPAAPLPECCLARNRYYDAVVNTANNQPAPTFSGLIILPTDNSKFKNNFLYYTPLLTYPPPAGVALASIVIRE